MNRRDGGAGEGLGDRQPSAFETEPFPRGKTCRKALPEAQSDSSIASLVKVRLNRDAHRSELASQKQRECFGRGDKRPAPTAAALQLLVGATANAGFVPRHALRPYQDLRHRSASCCSSDVVKPACSRACRESGQCSLLPM